MPVTGRPFAGPTGAEPASPTRLSCEQLAGITQFSRAALFSWRALRNVQNPSRAPRFAHARHRPRSMQERRFSLLVNIRRRQLIRATLHIPNGDMRPRATSTAAAAASAHRTGPTHVIPLGEILRRQARVCILIDALPQIE